ncbi:MAG: vWA domain-containing protein [Myxococcota bacterium]|nr:vWA domain-containing protein [Myxococcota bacterium]
MRPNVRALPFILALLASAPAAAQDGGLPSWVEQDPFSEGGDDPLGIDRADRLERVEPTTVEEEAHAPIPVQRGEILHAIAGVRETHHEVTVELGHGLAVVEERMRFTSSARYPAELRYRLAVPEGASLAALEVCSPVGCRRGVDDPSDGVMGGYDEALRGRGARFTAPVAHAAPVSDARGPAIWVRAAPIRPAPRDAGSEESPLTLVARWVVPAPVRGGRVRLTLPARGRDHRVAPSVLRVRSATLSHGAVDDLDAVERPVERAAWEPAEITARLDGAPAIEAEVLRARCGERRCARARVVAAPQPVRPRDIVLLLDASPSTAGAARGRIAPAVAALLSALPSRSRLRVVAFAARAEAVLEAPTAPTDVPLVRVARALERELGSATRFEAAWELASPWLREARDPLVLVVGDGGLTTGDGARRALREAQRSGAELAFLNVADRRSTPGLRAAAEATDATIVDAGDEADRAARGHGMEALEERIRALLAPVIDPDVTLRVGRRTISLGALRAGEERVWEGPVAGPVRLLSARASAPPEALARALSDRLSGAPRALVAAPRAEPPRSCTASGTAPREDAPVPQGVRLALADTRRCDGPPPWVDPEREAPEVEAPERLARHADRSGLPARSLLHLLRQRIVPVARGCFRDDRRGRAAYSTRAVYSFRLADREVIDASVEGRLSAELRACLERAIDGLEVPPFEGSVQVRYPLYTRAVERPPTLSLDADVADAVDALEE